MNRDRPEPQHLVTDIDQPSLSKQVTQAVRPKKMVHRLGQVGICRPVAGD
jgi:hypothetical protein